MKRYKYFFVVDHSSVSFANPYNGEIGQFDIEIPEDGNVTNIFISDSKEFSEVSVKHIGLTIVVELFAQNIHEGLNLAQIRANYTTIILSVIANATIADPISLIGIETTESAKITEFVQYLYMDGEVLKQKRKVDGDEFEKFLRAMMKSSEKRIGRAVRWYRKGLNEKDSIDRFMYYWLGLESLNKLLSEKFSEQPDIKICKNCGYTQENPTTNGIRALFNNLGDNLEFGYDKCRKLRAKLQHGFGDLEDVITVAVQCADSCRLMLIKGIFMLLETDASMIEKHPNPVLNLTMPKLEFTGVYEVVPNELKVVPSLAIQDENINISIENGKCKVSFLNRIDTNIPVDLKIKGINFIAENGVSMVIDDFNLTPKSED